MERFEGKSAIVTGAASGIGRATAIRLASEGADVAIFDINEDGLKETAATIEAAGGTVYQQTADLSTGGETCRTLVDFAVTSMGKLDILCNIAGIAKAKHFEDVTDDEWDLMLSINLSAVFHTCRAAIPHLIETKGTIINMSSTAGLDGQVYNTGYCATKAGVLMFTKALALEFAGRGVRANAICPGTVLTPLVENFDLPEDADWQLMTRMFSLLEPAQPEEIASAVAYLASEEARFVTGAAFPIDGAQTAG